MTAIDMSQPERSGGRRSPGNRPAGGEAAARRRRRGTVPGDVADHLRRRILAGELRAGERIDQYQIAAELEVSRSPIREAVVLLSQEGLLELIPNRGAQVCELRPDDVIDHYRLLGDVAGDAAALAADRFGEAERGQLRAIVERGRTLGFDDREEQDRLHGEFVEMIASAAPRRTQWLAGLLVRSLPLDPVGLGVSWIASAQQDRFEVLDAVERRDPEVARNVLRRHLHTAGDQMVDLLTTRAVWRSEQPGRTPPSSVHRAAHASKSNVTRGAS